MRSKLLACFGAALLVVGCSQKGTVVEKRLKPSPFAYSTGVDGIYSFLLRDEQGRVHSQMVTPDVFQRYEVGDYFDDQQSGPARRESGFSNESSSVSDSKEIKPVRHSAHKRHRASTTSHKPKRRALRAAVKPREDERAADKAQTASGPSGTVTLRPATPQPQGLDVRP